MTVSIKNQSANPERRRFTWDTLRGSIYVMNEGGGWGYIAVSGKQLIDIARQTLGKPDEAARNALDHTYTTWSDVNPYQFADLLYQVDQLAC